MNFRMVAMQVSKDRNLIKTFLIKNGIILFIIEKV